MIPNKNSRAVHTTTKREDEKLSLHVSWISSLNSKTNCQLILYNIISSSLRSTPMYYSVDNLLAFLWNVNLKFFLWLVHHFLNLVSHVLNNVGGTSLSWQVIKWWYNTVSIMEATFLQRLSLLCSFIFCAWNWIVFKYFKTFYIAFGSICRDNWVSCFFVFNWKSLKIFFEFVKIFIKVCLHTFATGWIEQYYFVIGFSFLIFFCLLLICQGFLVPTDGWNFYV